MDLEFLWVFLFFFFLNLGQDLVFYLRRWKDFRNLTESMYVCMYRIDVCMSPRLCRDELSWKVWQRRDCFPRSQCGYFCRVTMACGITGVQTRAWAECADGLPLFGRRGQYVEARGSSWRGEETEWGGGKEERSRATILDDRHESPGKTNGKIGYVSPFEDVPTAMPASEREH